MSYRLTDLFFLLYCHLRNANSFALNISAQRNYSPSFKSSMPLFSFYRKGGSSIVLTSRESVQQAWKEMLFFTYAEIFSSKKGYQLLYKN